MTMNDLISRVAAIGCLGNSPEQMCMPWSEVERMLRELPAVDAVPVVRCKNCKHWEADWKPNNAQDGVRFCPMVSLVRRGDWFCADGERSANDG